MRVNRTECDGCGKGTDKSSPHILESPAWYRIKIEGGELDGKIDLTLDACSDPCLSIVLRRQVGDAS